MGRKLNIFAWLLTVIATIALLNWGTVTLFNFDIVTWISFGQVWLDKTIKVIAGITGLLLIPTVIAMIHRKRR